MTAETRPTFSVILPTHNRANILPRAIRSVLNQTFQDFELLIVDDASTDDTRGAVELFRDDRIVFIQRETNGGAAASRNTGILRARGKYVSLLDDDDEYLSEFLVNAHSVMEAAPESVGFAWCGVRWVRDTDNVEKFLKEELWFPKFRDREHAYLSFLGHRRIGTNCGLTMRRSIFEMAGMFDEQFKGGAEDTDFLIRLVRLCDFTVIPGIFLKTHLHPGPSLRSFGLRHDDYERIIHKNLEALEKHPELWASLCYKTGWLHYHGGNKARGRVYMWQAVRKHPIYFKAWLGLVLFETFGTWAPQLHKHFSALKGSLFSRQSG